MANVVVTGGAGFIGSNLVDALIAKNHTVTVIDNLSTGAKKNINSKAIFCKTDIRNFSFILKHTKDIDYIFHLAALPRIQRSISNPMETNEVNVQGTLNVLESARLNKVKKVIFASSSSVYGDQNTLPLKESMKPNPLSPYALQKLTGEWYCKLYHDLYKLETVSLRLFSVYGPRQNENEEHATIIAKFHHLTQKGKALSITGTGEQTRDFTHVDDVVVACLSTLSTRFQGRGHVYNVCSAKPYSINTLARLIGGKVYFVPKKEGEIQNMTGDYSALHKATKWKPKHNLEDYLKSVYA